MISRLLLCPPSAISGVPFVHASCTPARYPALSEEEERISLPLQALCLALFDASLVYMMNTLSVGGGWLTIKRRLCEALFVNKQARTLEVLCGPAYSSCDAVFLQEVRQTAVPRSTHVHKRTKHQITRCPAYENLMVGGGGGSREM